MGFASKTRWRIWGLLTRAPGVCPANAYSLVIGGQRRDPRIDSLCRELANGSCWCGRLRDTPDHITASTGESGDPR